MPDVKVLVLQRVWETPTATFGVLIYKTGNYPFAVTGELPWKDNRQNVSCIPPGVYTCQWVKTKTKGWRFMVLAVPNRTGVLFHTGVVPIKHSKGCIITAEQFEQFEGTTAVFQSSKGYSEMMEILRGDKTFILNIKGVP